MSAVTDPIVHDERKDAPNNEMLAAGSILVAGEPVLEESPPIAHHFTVESQKEVTIRQVAPLVIVLTGATFLNASVSPTATRNRVLLTVTVDNLSSVRCHHPAFNKSRPQYPRNSPTMGRLCICPDSWLVPAALG